jgi:hypothetical protein
MLPAGGVTAMRKSLSLALIVAALAGCSAMKDEAAAEQAVTRFHRMLDAGRYDEIYDLTGPEMKGVTPRPAFIRLLQTIHNKLGAVRQSKPQGWNVNYGSAGAIVRLAFQTDFAGGRGTEQFVYRAGPAPALIGYKIDSNDLILK